MTKRLIALPVALIALAELAPAAANATAFNTSVSIGIAGSGAAFTGTVGSTQASCKVNRAVTLQRKKPGQPTS